MLLLKLEWKLWGKNIKLVVGILIMALGERFSNTKLGSVVSQHEITKVYKVLDIFWTASPF